jgi:hypothetical protein
MPNPDEIADAELSRLLALIDHPMPRVSAGDVIARARAPRARRSVLMAAAAVIAMASVAAATVPGAPVLRYLQRLHAARSPAPPARVATDSPSSDAASRGIAFTPGATVEVEFRAAQAAGAVQVRWADVPTVRLTQSGSTGDAHYALTTNGVIVDNAGSLASYTLVLPRTVADARVRIGDRVVMAKRGDSVSCTGMREKSGACVIAMDGGRNRRAPGAGERP